MSVAVEIPELSSLAICVMCIAVLLSAIITSTTGMAGGLLMFAAMSIYIPLRPLVAIHGCVQVFNNGARSWYLRTFIKRRECACFSIGVIAGAAVTTLVISRYINEFWPILVLTLLIIYTLFKPKHLPQIKVSPNGFIWVGFVTGVFSILVGVVDTILGVFFMRDDMSKEEIIANKSVMQTVTHFTKFPAFTYLGFSFFDHWQLIAILSIAGVIGTKLGIWLLHKLNNACFFLLMRLALGIALIRMCMQLIQLS